MATILVLGAGVSGHTASMTLKRQLGSKHKVVVISPNSKYQWIPSNIWVGVGRMTSKEVTFPLAPVYQKMGIEFHQASAKTIFPEGGEKSQKPYVDFEYTSSDKKGQNGFIEYDYLINATGPKLNFEGTEGLGPTSGHTVSVCTYDHAVHAWEKLQHSFELMEKGHKQRFLIGVGHPTATCQGAAFEYALNISFEIEKRNLSDKAEITWITNEYELGDFGMGGAFVDKGGYITSTKIFTESILSEYGINWIKRAGVKKVEQGKVYYENLEGENHIQEFDFAMLIPQFTGVGLKAFDKKGIEITEKIFAPSKLMKVDANYGATKFEDWKASDWPSTYQSPTFSNIFAVGIAFAPPHAISKPMNSTNGLPIFPTPPRTGMPSGVMGKIVAENIAHQIKTGKEELIHKASMARMGAACIISAGFGLMEGQAATMTVYPIVPDYEKYAEWGRDIKYTVGEPGLAGHWLKHLLHHLFMYKAKGHPLWWMIPE